MINHKKCSRLDPDHRVPGVYSQLNSDGSLLATGQGVQDKEGMQAPREGLGLLPSSLDRCADLVHSSNSDCTSALQGSPMPQDKNPSLQQAGLQPQEPDISTDLNWWMVNLNSGISRPILTSSLSESGDRCIWPGLPVSGIFSENRGALVQSRSYSPHKLAELKAAFLAGHCFAKEWSDIHPAVHGEQGSNSLCESPRAHSLQDSLQLGTGVL